MSTTNSITSEGVGLCLGKCPIPTIKRRHVLCATEKQGLSWENNVAYIFKVVSDAGLEMYVNSHYVNSHYC